MKKKVVFNLTLMFSLAGAVCSTGCESSTRQLRPGTPMGDHPIARAPMHSDIYKVVKFFPAQPWLSFDPAGDPDPEGFKVTLYLISSATREGEFGDGVIHVRMWPGETAGESSADAPLLKEWRLSPGDALPYRVVKRSFLGHGYQLRLDWGPQDILGKFIRVQIDFARNDGRIIVGQSHELRVPRTRTSRKGPTAAKTQSPPISKTTAKASQ